MLQTKQLRSAAKELNEVLDLDTPMDVTLNTGELVPLMRQAIGLIDPKKDKFTDETTSVIAELVEGDKPDTRTEKQKATEQANAEKLSEEKIGKAKTKTTVEPKADKAKEKVKTEKVKTEKSATSKQSAHAERIAILTPMIEKGTYTRAELIEFSKTKFPELAESSIATMFTDAKNPAYNKFPKLVISTPEGKLAFKK